MEEREEFELGVGEVASGAVDGNKIQDEFEGDPGGREGDECGGVSAAEEERAEKQNGEGKDECGAGGDLERDGERSVESCADVIGEIERADEPAGEGDAGCCECVR